MSSIVAAPAAQGLWLDTSTPLTPAVIRAIKSRGYLGVFRYGPLPGVSARNDISGQELADILKEGLQCGIVQHVRFPGWRPADHSGVADAKIVCRYMILCGYPTGAVIYQDLEGISGTLLETEKIANDWAGETANQHQQPGIYAGYQDPLGAQELFYIHAAKTYWTDSGPHTVAQRGHAVKQGKEITISGVRFDVDYVAPDNFGEVPLVATLEP